MTSEEKRMKVNQIFWGLVRKMGPDGEDIARAILSKMYPRARRSTRNLSLDEFASLVVELGKRTRTPVDLAWMRLTGSSRKGVPPRHLVQDAATIKQLIYCLDVAQDGQVDSVTMTRVIQTLTKNNKSGLLSVKVMQAFTEAIKSIVKRKGPEEKSDLDKKMDSIPYSWVVEGNSKINN